MTKRTRRLLLLALVAGLATLAGLWLLWPRTAITRENAERIQVGMTLAEVEAILGGPARDETTGPVAADVGNGPDSLWLNDVQFANGFDASPRSHTWQSDRVLILVCLDAGGRVANCIAFPQRRAEESLLAMLRRWLRL